MNFERTETDFIKSKAKEEVSDPRLGRVIEVYEHQTSSDDSNFEADVIIGGEQYEERSIPISENARGSIAIPEVGDTVVVDYMAGEGNSPVITGIHTTNQNRPPIGRAGMEKTVFESGESPAGTGNIHLTGYTEYDKNPALTTISERVAERAWIQISKHDPARDPVPKDDANMTIEMLDDPKNDAANITLAGNTIDGDDSKSVSVDLDMKSGDIIVKAENTSGEFGLKLDVNNGTFTIVDESGYGIESDGAGNFTWHHESIDMSEGTTISL